MKYVRLIVNNFLSIVFAYIAFYYVNVWLCMLISNQVQVMVKKGKQVTKKTEKSSSTAKRSEQPQANVCSEISMYSVYMYIMCC